MGDHPSVLPMYTTYPLFRTKSEQYCTVRGKARRKNPSLAPGAVQAGRLPIFTTEGSPGIGIGKSYTNRCAEPGHTLLITKRALETEALPKSDMRRQSVGAILAISTLLPRGAWSESGARFRWSLRTMLAYRRPRRLANPGGGGPDPRGRQEASDIR